jgi:hypothetical protein
MFIGCPLAVEVGRLGTGVAPLCIGLKHVLLGGHPFLQAVFGDCEGLGIDLDGVVEHRFLRIEGASWT